MMPAVGVGAKICQRVAIDRPVPDDVVGTSADRGAVVAPRHRVADELFAFRQAECIKIDQFAPNRRRHIGFVNRRAPGDIAGVVWLHAREELCAHGGAETIGADQEIAALVAAVGKDCRHTIGVLLNARQPFAQPIVLASEVADATQFMPGPVSVKAILSRAGLKERKRTGVAAAINACDTELLCKFVDGVEPAPLVRPLHFAIHRKLEAGDDTSWAANWSAVTGIHVDVALPGIELGNLFYRERLGLKFGD